MTQIQDGPAVAVGNDRRATHLRRYLAVAVVLLAVRLILLVLLRDALPSVDASEYVTMAQQLVSGEHFLPYWPPGLPLYLAPIVAMTSSLFALRAAMLLLWLVACWGLWRLMQALDIDSTAWLVLLLFGLLPDSIFYSVEPLTQMAVAALLLVASSSAVRIVRGLASRPLAEFLLAGAALAAAALVRPSGLVLLPTIPLLCGWASRRWRGALAGIALGLAMVGAWMLRADALSGHFLINNANGKNLYLGNNPWTPDYKTWYLGTHAKLGDSRLEYSDFAAEQDEVDRSGPYAAVERYQQLALHEIFGHPARFAWRTSNRFRCFWAFDTFAGAQIRAVDTELPLSQLTLGLEALLYLGLVLPSAWWLARASRSFWRRPEVLLLSATVVLYALPYWLSMSHPTYHFPVLALLGALGAMAFAQRERSGSRWRGVVAVTFLLLVQVEWVWQMTREVL